MTTAPLDAILQHLRHLAPSAASGPPSDAELLGGFVARRDEAAFTELVRRHGPMVLGVCRNVLRQEEDAEDAFQATFLALARQASTIRLRESVAGWLCGVAYRLALKVQAARGRARRGPVGDRQVTDPLLDMTMREVRQVLYEELQRLPEKYRLPLVLCYLEGRTQAQAALQLGWSLGVLPGCEPGWPGAAWRCRWACS
jgi:RNA polymerase sigma factor (sigma-70 family)